jgi:hypothetical protein
MTQRNPRDARGIMNADFAGTSLSGDAYRAEPPMTYQDFITIDVCVDPMRSRAIWTLEYLPQPPVIMSVEGGEGRGGAVKMIAEYLEHALQFEKMAKDETDAALKEQLIKQAEAYRNLAEERARRLDLPAPPRSS